MERWTLKRLREEGFAIDPNSRRGLRAVQVSVPESKMKKHKYGAVKTTIDGITFDSKREARRYLQLKQMAHANLISKLEVNAALSLKIEYVFERDGTKFASYQPDFRYLENGNLIVEDAKGKKTKSYITKRRLMKELYGITIRET